MTMRSKQIWLLIGILALGTILRMYDLSGESLWVDEGFSVDISRHNISKIYLLTSNDVHPPFYYFVLHYWMGIWGDSESAVRSLSALFGIAAILIFYKIGILIFNELTALIASSFAAISIFYIEYSQETRMYSLLLLLSLLSYYFYLKVLKDERSVYYNSIILLLLNILVAYTHVYGLFILITQAVFSLIYCRQWNRFNRRTWVIIQILWGILFLPWVWALVTQVKRAPLFFGTKEPTNMEFVYAMVNITKGRISFLIFLAVCILAIIKIHKYEKTNDKYILKLLLLWFILPVATVFLISKLIVPIYHAKYLIGATPPIFLLAAKGIEQLKKSSWAFYLVGGLIILAMVTKLYPYYRYLQKEPWRNFVNYIGKNWEEADAVIIYPKWATTTFNYYAKGRYPIHKISTQVGYNVSDMDKRYWLICYDCDNQERKRLIDHINIKDNFNKVVQFQHMTLYRSRSN